MLKECKQFALKTMKNLGAFRLVENTRWRRERLLVFAYHGISIDDEHEWSPELFMDPESFRNRMQLLKDLGCNILPLGEAIKRLYDNSLPERSVALTFDDGFRDFHALAMPILKEFKYPATVYLTSYYSTNNYAVFDSIVSYLLWKGRNHMLDLSDLTGRNVAVDLSEKSSRESVFNEIMNYSIKEGLTAIEKNDFVVRVAGKLGIDYKEIVRKRILHLMNPDEVREVATQGFDIQLHTHRHRVPLDKAKFDNEISDNRNFIRQTIGSDSEHFCYPDGVYHPEFIPWLEGLKVKSATTCHVGLASPTSHPLLLPRLVDSSLQAPIEIEGWLSGVSASLPSREGAIAYLRKISQSN